MAAVPALSQPVEKAGVVTAIHAGVRVRMQGPWAERVGCVGTVVAPSTDKVYPQPAPWEVLVKLDDDPLGYNDRWWTCVVARKDVEVID